MSSKTEKKIVIVRRKKGNSAGHQGGSWKVAYADFVTAMMAFFLVMWIIGMDEEARNAIEGYFSNPVGYRKGYSSGSSPITAGNAPSSIHTSRPIRLIMRAAEVERFERTGSEIEQRIRRESRLRDMAMHVEIITTEKGLRIELIEGGSGETFFAFGSRELKPAAKDLLAIIGDELAELENPIVVEGHTDSAPFQSAGYTNWELSTDRAHAARRAIEAAGVRSDRISEIRGYGDTRLRVPSDPRDASNRRISILLPFTSADAGEAVATAPLISTG